MENLDFFYRTAGALSVNIVTNLKGFEHQNDQSSCKVGEVAGQSHTDCHTGRGQDSSEAGGFNTQTTYDGKGQNQVKQNAQQAFQESLYTDFQLALFKNFGYQPADLPDDEASDDVNKNGTDEVFSYVDSPFNQFVDNLGNIDHGRCFGCSIK